MITLTRFSWTSKSIPLEAGLRCSILTATARNKLTLQQLIPRIIHDRGAFINITEDSLLKEIESLDTPVSPLESMSMITEEDGTQSITTINEKFYKDKNEVLKYISMALNECSLSLDFVSLLISCVRPAAGTISMSSHLKKFIPPGSLNADLTTMSSTKSKEQRFQEDKVVGQGWKLASLESSADVLHNAAARLSEEVHREHMFWNVLKKNFNNKEILYKTRDKSTGKRVFGVKFGYEDSGSSFKKGNALLKPQGEALQFQPLIESQSRIIRVRLLTKSDDDVAIIGESKTSIFPTDESIRTKIQMARHFIFEEELWNQLMDESLSLIANGVRIDNENKITIMGESQIVDLEFIDYDESPQLTHEEDNRAELFSSYLRLMLSLKHKHNLESKKHLTVLKTSQRIVMRPYAHVLRPLVGLFRHEELIGELYTILKAMDGCTLKLKRYSNITKEEYALDSFKCVSKPPMTTFYLQNGDLKVKMELDSYDFVNFMVNVKATHQKKSVLSIKFEQFGPLEECLDWLIATYSS